MKKGQLTVEEKNQIIELLSTKSINEISELLDRTPESINKYLDFVKNAIEEKPEIIHEGLNSDILAKVMKQLLDVGLSKQTVAIKINKVVKLLTEGELQSLSSDELYSLCLRQLNLNDIMVNKTASGESGIAVMTEAASQIGDTSPKKTKQKADYVYKFF